MHIPLVTLGIILVLAILASWANRTLNSTASQKWVYVAIAVIAVLAALHAMGVSPVATPPVSLN